MPGLFLDGAADIAFVTHLWRQREDLLRSFENQHLHRRFPTALGNSQMERGSMRGEAMSEVWCIWSNSAAPADRRGDYTHTRACNSCRGNPLSTIKNESPFVNRSAFTLIELLVVIAQSLPCW